MTQHNCVAEFYAKFSLTQQNVAEILQVDCRTVRRWLSGEAKISRRAIAAVTMAQFIAEKHGIETLIKMHEF